MTVRIRVIGEFFGKLGTVVRTSASGGLWVRIDEWPAEVPDAFGGEMWFERDEFEVVAARAAA